MKLTDSEVIKDGEKELIDAVTADLDWGAIEEVFRKEHRLGIEEDVEYKKGDIVVYDNQVAYKLEFEVKVTLSVLLDREGNYLSVASSGDLDKTQDEDKGELLEGPEELDEESEEKGDSDLEGLVDIGEELQTEGEPEGTLTDDDVAESNGESLEEEEELDNKSEEKGGSDLEGLVDTGGDLETDNEPEKAPTDDDAPKPEDQYKEALAELDSTDNPENADRTPPRSAPEDSQERISRMASQVGEVIAEIDGEE